MINELFIAILIVSALTVFSWLMFLIYTIVFRNEYENAPKIHTIRDIFKQIDWRIKNTAIGDAMSCPVIINWFIAIYIFLFLVLCIPVKIVEIFYKCFKNKIVHIKFITDFNKFVIKTYNNFMDITIFK